MSLPLVDNGNSDLDFMISAVGIDCTMVAKSKIESNDENNMIEYTMTIGLTKISLVLRFFKYR